MDHFAPFSSHVILSLVSGTADSPFFRGSLSKPRAMQWTIHAVQKSRAQELSARCRSQTAQLHTTSARAGRTREGEGGGVRPGRGGGEGPGAGGGARPGPGEAVLLGVEEEGAEGMVSGAPLAPQGPHLPGAAVARGLGLPQEPPQPHVHHGGAAPGPGPAPQWRPSRS